MSLVVWLPMTKDLRQQGLSDVEVTNNGATFNSAGKLGGCYKIAPSQGMTLPASAMTSFTTECSIAFWIKINDWNTSYATFFQAGLSSTPWAHYRFGILRNQSTSKLCFAIANSSGSSSAAGYVTSDLTTGEWYQLAFTYTNGKVKCYRNGVLDKEYTTSIIPDFAGITNISIGRCTDGTSYKTNCDINDFRIYDHCLSPMEVKQISQGLVLHYPLDGLSNTKVPFGYQELEYIESSGSSYFNTGYKFNPEIDDCKVIFKGNDTENNGMIFADSGGKYFWIYYYRAGSRIALYASNGSAQQSVDYIAQDLNKHIVEYKDKTFYIDGVNKGSLTNTYSEDTNTIWLFSYGGSSYPFKGRIYYTEIRRNNKFQKIYIPAKRLSDSAIGMYELINNEFFVSASSTFIAGPAIGTSSIIYDASGFNNNGYIYQYDDTSIISIDTNSPRYSCATIVQSAAVTHAGPGTAYVVGDISISTPKELSICFWVSPISAGYGNSYGQGIFCTTMGTNTGTDYLASAMNQYDDGISFNSSDGSTRMRPSFVISGGWHHYAATYDGQTARLYKDGIQTTTQSFSTAQMLGSFDHVFFGFSKAGGVWRRNKCKWSDCRVYATALSANDVKNLYQNSAYIDNDGNTYSADYNEV